MENRLLIEGIENRRGRRWAGSHRTTRTNTAL